MTQQQEEVARELSPRTAVAGWPMPPQVPEDAATPVPGPHNESPELPDDRIAQAKHEWETTVDALTQLVCLLDEKGRVVRANRVVETWRLGNVADVKGQSLHALLHPQCTDANCYMCTFWPPAWEDVRKGKAATCEVEDDVLGRRLSIQLRALATPASVQERASRAVVVIDDVTDLKRAEAMLRNGLALLEQQVAERTRDLQEANVRLSVEVAERRMAEQALQRNADEVQDLYNHAPCGYHSLDADGIVVQINDTELGWLGYTREQVVGKLRFSDLLTPEGARIFAETFPRLKERGSVANLEYDVMRKDGTTFPVLVSASAIRDEDGRYLRSRSTVWNISERKRIEAALRKSEESYRRLVDTMLEGLVVYDPQGRISYVNDSFCRMLGFERAELVGMPAEKIIHGARQCTVEELRSRHLCCSCGRYEARLKRKDGEGRTVLLSPQRLDGADGEFLGCFSVVMDITDRKHAEEALQRSQTELRLLSAQLLAAQEAERKRIALELHDSIGQMLSALKFQLENAATLIESDDPQAVTELIGRLVPRIQSAVDEVRRISSDLRPAMLDDLGILPTIAWFCREFQGVYRHLRIETALSVREEEVPASLKTAIYRIAQEALNNIAQHARATAVQVALVRPGATLELSVRDDGVGFEPAHVIPSADRPQGLGLSAMRERAETSGGKFWLESSAGGGTLVRVAWPCLAER